MRALAMIGAIALAASATGVAAPPGETMSDKLREAIADGLILMATVFVNTGAAVTTNRFTQAEEHRLGNRHGCGGGRRYGAGHGGGPDNGRRTDGRHREPNDDHERQ
jgi:hypothetical protein